MQRSTRETKGTTMISKISRLDEKGIREFRNMIKSSKGKEKHPADRNQLEKIIQKYTIETREEIKMNPTQLKQDFRTKLDFGRFLVDLIPYTVKNERAIYLDLVGIGTWLALKFIEVITEPEDYGRKLNAEPRYIPDLDSPGTIYRHDVLGAWKIYGVHQDQARVFLLQPPSSLGIISELSISHDIMESPAVCDALTRFLLNQETMELKKDRPPTRDIRIIMRILRAKYNLRLIKGEMLYQAFVRKLS